VAKIKIPFIVSSGNGTPVVQPVTLSLYWMRYPSSRSSIFSVQYINKTKWRRLKLTQKKIWGQFQWLLLKACTPSDLTPRLHVGIHICG
jgi:hypothetical protein